MKNTPHWTSEQLLDSLYGIGPEDSHLDGCAECRAKLDAMRSNRSAREIGQWIPDEFFAQQRHQILQRTASKPRRVWIPALATAAAGLALAVTFQWNSPEPVADDPQLYTSIYQSIESEEPRAAAPMHALFEEATSDND